MGRQPTPDVIDAARTAAKATGIPASIIIGQWALESGWGAHMPPGSNNPFGEKAIKGQPAVRVPTREVIGGKSVIINASFRAFPSLTAAFDSHAAHLASSTYYAKARAALPDVKAFANALTGVYATDPLYGKLLISVMNGSNLYAYDK